MNYTYYLAYNDGNMVIRWNNKYDDDTFTLEKFDKEKRKWVADYGGLAGIFVGSIPVRIIPEEEARKLTGEN
jgi:hypothetical protein